MSDDAVKLRRALEDLLIGEALAEPDALTVAFQELDSLRRVVSDQARRVLMLEAELARRPLAFVDPAPEPEPAFLRVLRRGNKARVGLMR